ncbi:tRNA (adenine(22)-N(1))-methyltransferase [Clostridium sp. Marseille-P3244]|uniref:tRNA (adenine(22)-N(1))-methyltransferase n=1 Tax=Clostridium sp. Marseille-P3244 TaxID=1871020 RepID=UPI0009310B86|nr:class I SAM-dependent methyltransferase [Clostridium sp. Marseille-P3244]
MELSNRMSAVASLVTEGLRLADIGTDHGYIPISLAESGQIPAAIAMDVNNGPLLTAEKNIRVHGLGHRISTRISDGFSALRPGEADTAVIAGMGGALTVRILREGMTVVRSLKECILQPQSEIRMVRAFLLEEGFLFIREVMVKEDGKYYVVMKVKPPSEKENHRNDGSKIWDETELKYGRLLLENRDPVLEEYLNREKTLCEKILKRLEGQKTGRVLERRRQLEQELVWIRKGMDQYAV